MNTANKLTVFRMILVPVFVVFMLISFFGEYTKWVALGIFILASLTDKLDGTIARKYNMVTNFGKFMDPIADKLLVTSALICLIELGSIPSWAVIIIISREFLVSGFRLIASQSGKVIAASFWAKFKTVAQMVMIMLMIANLTKLSILTAVIMYIAIALTVISMIEYVIKNRDVLSDIKAK